LSVFFSFTIAGNVPGRLQNWRFGALVVSENKDN
jgi:hypothetical protein